MSYAPNNTDLFRRAPDRDALGGMLVMLRRGAPLSPRMTLVLAAIAVAALGNVGLRLFHVGDPSVMILVWHLGIAAVLVGIASLLGRQVLGWRSTLARPRLGL